jgi:hypothetical protein
MFFQRTLQITHAFGDGGNVVKRPPILGPLRFALKEKPHALMRVGLLHGGPLCGGPLVSTRGR